MNFLKKNLKGNNGSPLLKVSNCFGIKTKVLTKENSGLSDLISSWNSDLILCLSLTILSGLQYISVLLFFNIQRMLPFQEFCSCMSSAWKTAPPDICMARGCIQILSVQIFLSYYECSAAAETQSGSATQSMPLEATLNLRPWI